MPTVLTCHSRKIYKAWDCAGQTIVQRRPRGAYSLNGEQSFTTLEGACKAARS